MNRRTFLKNSGAGGLLTLVTPTELIYALDRRPAAPSSLQAGFRSPPAAARPHTWWHWMNGHVTQDGITRDLEAMQRVGIGGFQNFSVGSGIPLGPVVYGSPEWLRLMQHTIREADRLGLEFQLHNCPGWSSSGGPWITPARTMQQVTWSETVVRGGKQLTVSLPEPFKRLGHYRDVAVLAFPAPAGERQTWTDTLTSISTPAGPADVAQLVGGTGPGLAIEPGGAGQPGTLLLEFSAPFEARSVLLYTAAPASLGGGRVLPVGPVGLEASADGTTFRPVAELPLVIAETPGAASFAPVRARFFRLTFPLAARVTQVRLSGATRLNDWTTKANFAGAQPGTAATASAAPGPAVPAEEVIDPARLIDLTPHLGADGQLTWAAPAGDWVVLRLGHTATDRLNKAAPTTGQGLECDKFSREAFDFHFHHMLDELLPALSAMRHKSQVGLLIDSYEVGMQNWTPGFPQAFRASRGYELLPYLPALTGRVVGSAEATEQFLWDLRRTQADLMADNYYGRCAALCHEQGFLAYTEPYNGGPFEQLQAGARMDVSMGEFWVRTLRFRHSLRVAASVQHVNGRAVVGAEAFTGDAVHAKWQEFPYSMKADGDYMFTQGLNRMIFHRYAHQPHPTARPGMTMGPWGIHLDRTNTWFEPGAAWFTYLARCQYLLQQGQFVADLLYLTADDAPGEDLSLRPAPTPAPPVGYDYDNINTESLLRRATVADGQLALPEGQRYRLLVLPLRPAMSLPLLRKLHALVGQGLNMLGPRPVRSASLVGGAAAEAEWQRLAAELWGGASGPGAAEGHLGPGRVFVGQSVPQVLAALRVPPDVAFSTRSADPALNYIHRRAAGHELYFVANRKRRPETVVATFRATGRPEFWNPVTGETLPAAVYETTGGRTRVALELAPAGSVFVVFRAAAPARPLRSIALDGRVVLGLAAFPAQPFGQHRAVVNDFTLSAWLKPECDITLPGTPMARFGLASFAFFPAEGEALYGPGHAVAGVRVGRNAVVVHERRQDVANAVLVLQKPLSGWTHLALVYRAGAPLVYLNGELAGQGPASGLRVHPGLGDERPDGVATYFEGDIGTPQLAPQALSAAQVRALAATAPPRPPAPPVVQSAGAGLLFWQNGAYTLQDQAGRRTSLTINYLPQPIELAGAWRVSFPEGLGAPATATLPRLHSLHLHAEPGIRYFSGTATYHKAFRAAKPGAGQRLFLDLGAVAVLAEVVLNGRRLGTLWQPPFRLDITDAVRPGDNQLQVRVTNLWPNRLIGDEQQPAEHAYAGEAFGQTGGISALPDWYLRGQPQPAGPRVAFTTWQHYHAASPLLEAGLIGPVRLLAAAQPPLPG